eukprot:GHVL01038060.1.p1 GENE.GHVL01038060.1~~GHVL01038060.1.p1  ORF type:complete len:386 (-),score=60.06 GHVL01038060.1:44-1174(-)
MPPNMAGVPMRFQDTKQIADEFLECYMNAVNELDTNTLADLYSEKAQWCREISDPGSRHVVKASGRKEILNALKASGACGALTDFTYADCLQYIPQNEFCPALLQIVALYTQSRSPIDPLEESLRLVHTWILAQVDLEGKQYNIVSDFCKITESHGSFSEASEFTSAPIGAESCKLESTADWQPPVNPQRKQRIAQPEKPLEVKLSSSENQSKAVISEKIILVTRNHENSVSEGPQFADMPGLEEIEVRPGTTWFRGRGGARIGMTSSRGRGASWEVKRRSPRENEAHDFYEGKHSSNTCPTDGPHRGGRRQEGRPRGYQGQRRRGARGWEGGRGRGGRGVFQSSETNWRPGENFDTSKVAIKGRSRDEAMDVGRV